MLAPDYIPEDLNELDSGTPDSDMCAIATAEPPKRTMWSMCGISCDDMH